MLKVNLSAELGSFQPMYQREDFDVVDVKRVLRVLRATHTHTAFVLVLYKLSTF